MVFLRDDAQQALCIGRRAFLGAAERLQRKGYLLSPRHGFYVIVPPQFHAWGAPPPSWYIDRLMNFEEQNYYVALLKAAELHGASHQAVMEYQVVTNKRIPKLESGRSWVTFHYRKEMETVLDAIEEYKTDTGTLKVSSTELTLFDLLRYPHAGGGFDNVATVLTALAGRIKPRRLVELVPAFEKSIVRRLGYLLDVLGFEQKTQTLYKSLTRDSDFPWIELEPVQYRDAELLPGPLERNRRWHVIVRRIPEPDE